MTDVGAVLDAAAPATRRVPLCFDADANTALNVASRMFREARGKARQDAEQAYLEAAEQAEPSMLVFEVGPVPPDVMWGLYDDHPPRRNGDKWDQLDLNAGYNRRTFRPALIRAAVRSPEITDTQWGQAFAAMTPGQFDRLFKVAELMSGQVTPLDVPFGSAV